MPDNLANLLTRILEASDHDDIRTARVWMDELRHLRSQDKEFVLQVMREIRDTGTSPALDALWELDFDRIPVPIDQFLTDPYYFGESADNLYDIWRKELGYVCDPAAPVLEWILTGGLGIGKSWAALIGTAYKGIYYCSCLRNPQEYFGLSSNSKIVFGIFSVLKEQAHLVDLDQFMYFFDASPYFKEQFPRQPSNTFLKWPQKKMEVVCGSKELHTLGTNLFSVLIDEVNFMRQGAKGDEKGQAYRLYSDALNRMKNRFQRYGYCPGIACVISSRKTQSSWLEKHLKDVRHLPSVHVSDYAIWDAKGRDKYSEKTFRVAIGSRYRSSQILDELDPVTKEVINSKPCPAGQQVIEVPVDFYEQAVTDVDKVLRDQAGIPTHGEKPLVIRVESLTECIDPEREHPFISEEAILPFEDPQADLLQYVQWSKLVCIDEGSYRMRVRPGSPRVIHVDGSLSGDCTGIAMGHSYDVYSVSEMDPVTQQITENFRPKVYIDFMLRIRPVKGTHIDLVKIIQFILNLRNFGVPLAKVTFDGWQSQMGIQIIQKASIVPHEGHSTIQQRRLTTDIGPRIGAGKLSIDRNDSAYVLLRDAMNYRAINYYRYAPYLDEVSKLEHDPDAKNGQGKVDHPPNGSKDVSDAVAGVVKNLATMEVVSPQQDPDEVLDTPSYQADDLIEAQLMGNIMNDYPDKVHGVEPPPQPGQPTVGPKRNKGRSLSSKSGDLIQMLARHGKK